MEQTFIPIFTLVAGKIGKKINMLIRELYYNDGMEVVEQKLSDAFYTIPDPIIRNRSLLWTWAQMYDPKGVETFLTALIRIGCDELAQECTKYCEPQVMCADFLRSSRSPVKETVQTVSGMIRTESEREQLCWELLDDEDVDCNGSLYEKTYQMLRYWMLSGTATPQGLFEALKKVGRNDLVEIITQKLAAAVGYVVFAPKYD